MKKTTDKINETKSLFFEKINIIDKPLAQLSKKKRKRVQINKISNEKGEITLQLTPQKYKGSKETSTSNYMPIRWTT